MYHRIHFLFGILLMSILSLVSFHEKTVAQQNSGKIDLFLSKFEPPATVYLNWRTESGMQYKYFQLWRSTTPLIEGSYVKVDSTVNPFIAHTVPLPSFQNPAKYGFVVVGITMNGDMAHRSNPFIFELPPLPVANAFRLEARPIDSGKVLLIWNRPIGETVNDYSVYRITIENDRYPIFPVLGDSVLVATTKDTTFVDSPQGPNDYKKFYAYGVQAHTDNRILYSTPAFVGISGDPNRDQIKFTSIPGLTARIGEQYQYDADAVSSDPTAHLTYRLLMHPSGMTIDSISGVLSYIPAAKGYYGVRVEARSTKGGIAVHEYILVVSGGYGIVQGIVTDTANVPMENVMIEILKRDIHNGFVYRSKTNASGVYHISRIDPGNYLVHAIPLDPVYRDQWYFGKDSPQDANNVAVIDSPSVTTANFKLRSRFTQQSRHFMVSGSVTDTVGLPIFLRKTKVFFVEAGFARNTEVFRLMGHYGGQMNDFRFDGHSPFVFHGTTDSLGQYSIKMPFGKYIAFAVAEGFAPAFYNGKHDLLSADVLIIDSTRTGINFTLTALPPIVYGSISGSVLDTVKDIAVQARLLAFRDRWIPGFIDPYQIGRVSMTETDSTGAYTFSDLVPGKYIVLAVPADDYAPAFYGNGRRWKDAQRISIDGNIVSGIDIIVREIPDSLHGYTGVRGKVSIGIPPESAVNLSGTTTAGIFVYASTNDGTISGYGITEYDGTYAIEGIKPGTYSISVDGPGFQSTTSQSVSPTYDGTGVPVEAFADFTVEEVTSIKSTSSNTVPEQFSLSQNYPNPFNPSTTINFSIKKSGYTTLRVFNIIGQEVMTAMHENLPAGSYSATVSLEHLPSGVYFYQLRSGNDIKTKKMMLVK